VLSYQIAEATWVVSLVSSRRFTNSRSGAFVVSYVYTCLPRFHGDAQARLSESSG
jgi:hypothetical protein